MTLQLKDADLIVQFGDEPLELLQLDLLGGSDDNRIRAEIEPELDETTVDREGNKVALT